MEWNGFNEWIKRETGILEREIMDVETESEGERKESKEKEREGRIKRKKFIALASLPLLQPVTREEEREKGGGRRWRIEKSERFLLSLYFFLTNFSHSGCFIHGNPSLPSRILLPPFLFILFTDCEQHVPLLGEKTR